jgi:hypothetical protein
LEKADKRDLGMEGFFVLYWQISKKRAIGAC